MRYHGIIWGWMAIGLAAPAVAADPPAWSTPIEPFAITDNVYYVGTQGLSAYLIVSSAGAILLDGTQDRNAALIERNIRRVGVPLSRVRLIVSNHAHEDHVGALARIKRDTGARFLASAGDRWALEHGTSRGDADYAARRYPPIKVDRVVRDGEVVRLGDVALNAHLTPGHTPGCTSWSMTAPDRGVARQRALHPRALWRDRRQGGHVVHAATHSSTPSAPARAGAAHICRTPRRVSCTVAISAQAMGCTVIASTIASAAAQPAASAAPCAA